MNEYLVTVLAIIIVIGAGFALLINFGIDVVTYFGIGLVVFSIFGSLVYTWWRTQSDKTIERLKIEILVRIRRELREVDKLVRDASEIADMSSIQRDLKLLRENIVSQKFFDKELNISRAVGKYTLTFIEQEGRKVEQKLRSLEALAAGRCRPQLEKFIKELQLKLEKLQDAGYDIIDEISEFNIISAQPSKSLREMIEKKSRLVEKFDAILDKCIEEAASVATASRRFGDTSAIERKILDVKKMKGDFDNAVFHLVNARNELKDILRDVFTKQYTNLTSCVKGILNIVSADHIDQKYRDAIKEIRDELNLLNDPGRIQELRELEASFKSKTANIINELFDEMKELEENISLHQPHEKVWTPDRGIAPLVDKVNPAENLDDFYKSAKKALERLTRQLEKDVAFLKIIENYAKVEPIITRKLKEEGTITSSDLNVKYADKFMLLYSLKNPTADFEEDPPTLTLHSKVAAELKQKLLKKRRA